MTTLIRHITATFLLTLGLFAISAQADSVDDIVERGKLRVGVSLFTPWTIQSTKGKLAGFDVDVAKKIAADMGIEADLKVYKWDDIMPALAKGEIDMIAAGMAVTPKRALKVAFSDPYSQSGVTLVTHTENTENVNSLVELNREDITIVSVKDTVGGDLAQSVFDKATLKYFDTPDRAEQAVLDGKAHGYVATAPVARIFTMTHSDTVDMPLPEPLLSYKIAFAVRKGNQPLLNFLNAWITSRTTDRWVPATEDFWFESLEWQEAQ